jgi:hypothetical protein
MPVPKIPAILGRLCISLSIAWTSMRCLRSGDENAANLAETAGVLRIAVMSGEPCADVESKAAKETDVEGCAGGDAMLEDFSTCAAFPLVEAMRLPGDFAVILGNMACFADKKKLARTVQRLLFQIKESNGLRCFGKFDWHCATHVHSN